MLTKAALISPDIRFIQPPFFNIDSIQFNGQYAILVSEYNVDIFTLALIQLRTNGETESGADFKTASSNLALSGVSKSASCDRLSSTRKSCSVLEFGSFI